MKPRAGFATTLSHYLTLCVVQTAVHEQWFIDATSR